MDFIAEGFIQAFRMLLTMDEETTVIVVTTFKLTALSMAGVLLFGLPAGFLLGYFDFPGKRAVRTVTDTPFESGLEVFGKNLASASEICALALYETLKQL